MKKSIIAICLAGMALGNASAQTSQRKVVSPRMNLFASHIDSVKTAFASDLQAMASKSVSLSDEENVYLSPYMFRLTGQGMYYSSSVRKQFDIDWNGDCASDGQSEDMAYRDKINRQVDDLLASAYLASPGHFTHYDSQLQNEDIVENVSVTETGKDEWSMVLDEFENIKDVTEIVDDIDVSLEVKKPDFWKRSGKFALQFSQNYFSQTWYKGGENNGSMLSTLFLSANYNDQKLIQWDNSLDMRLGFMTAPSDTCHSYLTNNDKINFNSKVGIKATKSAWFYTFSMQAFTQFMPGYKANRKEAFSNFLAPLDVNASIGMDYKPKLKKAGNSLSVALLPLSYKLRYIRVDDDDYTIHKSYNMKDDDGEWLTTKHDFGSRLEYTHMLKLMDNLSWRSRLYYYTTYKYTEAEFENTFSLSFNKYLSADFYTLWRFDDNRAPSFKDSTLGYFQFKEYLTFGLTYSF